MAATVIESAFAADLPLLRAGRPLKRWRYVGVFCEELMACAALVQVGPARQCFWAVYPRAGRSPIGGPLRERTRMLTRRGAVELSAGQMQIRDGDVLLALTLEEDEGIEARCVHGGGEGHGGGEVWTRKQAGVRAHGTLALDGGPPRKLEALAVIDDTAGYHARRTEWWWSAGVGTGEDGVALAWNLVSGVNDPPTEAGRHSPPTEAGGHSPLASIPRSASIPVSASSERAVWIAGEPHEVAPVRFATDLSEILAEDGSRLSFAAEAQRRRREHLLIVSSDYTAPFGTFSGALPGGVQLASGLGVMEHHRAKW